MDLEPRIVRLEDAMSGILVALGRLDQRFGAPETRFDRLDARIDELAVKLDIVAVQVEHIGRRTKHLPSAWMMIVTIVGSQILLMGLIAAIGFGALWMIGH